MVVIKLQRCICGNAYPLACYKHGSFCGECEALIAKYEAQARRDAKPIHVPRNYAGALRVEFTPEAQAEFMLALWAADVD